MTMLSSNLSNAEIKTYEISGHLESSRHLSVVIIFCLFIFSAILIVALVYVARKPPALITLDSLGKASYIENYVYQNQAATEQEIRYFAKTFLLNYLAPNSEIIDYQMSQAMNWMAPSLQKMQKEDLGKNNSAEKIKKSRIKTELQFKKIDLEENTDRFVYVKVLGIREIYPSDKPEGEPERGGFKTVLRLKKIPRTEATPNALLVDYVRNEFVSVSTIEAWENREIPPIPK